MSEAVNATTQQTVQAPQTRSQLDRQNLTNDFDDFLTLLTTQLQNQDPLDPQDSSEFTNQLVQFSQVEQQINSNQKLEELVTLQDLSLTSIALGYIGMNVQLDGQEFNYKGEGSYEAFYELPPGGADSVQVTIYDENDQPIRTYQGSPEAGRHNVVWDGLNDNDAQVDAGAYRIGVTALNKEGEPIKNRTIVTATVDGIETVNGQIVMKADDLYIPFTSIQAASLPPDQVAAAQQNGS